MTTSNTKIHIAILDDYQNVALTLADWSALSSRPDVEITVFNDTLPSGGSPPSPELVSRLHPFQIICSMRERTKFLASLLSELPNLKLLTTTGMGNRGIDIAVAKERGIVVCGTGGGGNSTLEHIWALLLATVRFVAQEDRNTKESKKAWQSHIPMGLKGKTLGLVGVGRLGAATAAIAKAFQMTVLGWSPNLTPERAAAAGVTYSPSKSHLLQNSDIVSIHMVQAPSTLDLISSSDFNEMKKTAFLINTSRGPIVNEQALVEALKEGKIRGAGLDVFDEEPLPLDHPLRGLDNVTLTPHEGYVSDEAYGTWYPQTVENILAFLDGNPIRILAA